MFEPDKLPLMAFDPETGIKLVISSTADLEDLNVTVRFPDNRSVVFGIVLKPKDETIESSIDKTRNFFLQLPLAYLNQLAKFRNGSRQENTQFVRYVLQGLSIIHRRWPIIRDGYFYSDRDRYRGRDLNALFAFEIPEEDEISNL